MGRFYNTSGREPFDWTEYACREIADTYDAYVDPYTNAKSLNKFGRTRNADASTRTTIAEFLGAAISETFVTTNAIDGIVSDGAMDADTGLVTVEGHTIDSSGNLTFVVQNATLTGQTKSTLATPLARCTRLYRTAGTFASPATALVGNVYAYASSGVTLSAGVPQTDSSVKCMIAAGEQQSQKAATSISSTDYWLVTEISASALRATGAGAKVDVELEFRTLGGVWRPAGATLSLRTDTTAWQSLLFTPYRIIPANSDVRLVAVSSLSDTYVSGTIHGFLARVVG